MRTRILCVLLLCNGFLGTVFAQEGGGNGGGGGKETKIWSPDLVELWILLHKAEYAMLEEFKANEDTLRRKQNTEFEERMKEFRKVDETLFKQLQDNSVPKPMFQTSGNLDIMLSMKNLTEINKNMVQMVNRKPVDAQIVKEAGAHLLDMVLTTSKLYEVFRKHAMTGNDLKNLRDNRKRDEVVVYIRKELRRLIRVSNMKYDKFRVAKYYSTLDLKSDNKK